MRPDRPRLLAGWQRVSMWLAWLACFALCVAHADSGSLSLNEIAALCAAGTFTFW